MSNRNLFLSSFGHSDHLHKILDNKDDDDYKSNLVNVTKNPTVDHSHLTKLLKVDDSKTKAFIASHPDIKDSHVEHIMSDQSYNVDHVKQKLMANPKVSTSAIKKAFDDGDNHTQALIGKNRNLPKELRQHVLNNTYDPDVKRIINSRIKDDSDMDSFMGSIKDDPLLK